MVSQFSLLNRIRFVNFIQLLTDCAVILSVVLRKMLKDIYGWAAIREFPVIAVISTFSIIIILQVVTVRLYSVTIRCSLGIIRV